MPEEKEGGLLRCGVVVRIGYHGSLFVPLSPFAQFVEPMETVNEIFVLIAIRFIAGLEQ